MQNRLWTASIPKNGLERIMFTLARVLAMATLAVATYLEIRLSAH
jgi:hypothetical protein